MELKHHTRSRWNELAQAILAGCLAIATTLACRCSQDPDPADEDAVCDEIGFSIANRTLDCTGDTNLANARFEAFKSQYNCFTTFGTDGGVQVLTADGGAAEAELSCASFLFGLPCENVALYGDNLEAWLETSPSCRIVIQGADGGTITAPCDDPDGGGFGRVKCNGTCVPIQSDPQNCGECGNACPESPTVDQQAVCIDGTCGYRCATNYGDCDQDLSNGCEVFLLTDSKNCYACGNVCPAVNGEAQCSDGQCGVICDSEHLNCDVDVQNGCETEISPLNCYGCGSYCSAGGVVDSQCDPMRMGCTEPIYCPTGFLNCDLEPGCETQMSGEQCAVCGSPCPPYENAIASCDKGYCEYSCADGFFDCDQDITNGCERSADTVTDCNTCLGMCPIYNQTSVSCVNNACEYTCINNYKDCNMDITDGCEVIAACP